MTSRLPVIGGTAVALAMVGLAAVTLRAREARAPMPVSLERLMYLRSGAVARRVFLSFDALAADVYWIRTIQHYGRDRKSARAEGRFELLEPLLDLTTTLDPQFNRAYRFGAIFLAEPPPAGPGRPDQAIALLEKGLEENPLRWQYARDIAFMHYWYTGQCREAADWFERAASLPRAPEWLRPVAVMARARGGDRAGARQLVRDLVESDERYIRDVATRFSAQLDALDALDELNRRIADVNTRVGRFPGSWREMVGLGLLPGIPLDPSGVPFVYDPVTHAVTLSPDSSLAPLPVACTRQ